MLKGREEGRGGGRGGGVEGGLFQYMRLVDKPHVLISLYSKREMDAMYPCQRSSMHRT